MRYLAVFVLALGLVGGCGGDDNDDPTRCKAAIAAAGPLGCISTLPEEDCLRAHASQGEKCKASYDAMISCMMSECTCIGQAFTSHMECADKNGSLVK